MQDRLQLKIVRNLLRVAAFELDGINDRPCGLLRCGAYQGGFDLCWAVRKCGHGVCM